MTNDGALAQNSLQAGSHISKTYLVKVSGKPNEQAIQKLRAGVSIPLEEGRRVKLACKNTPHRRRYQSLV